MNPENPYTDTTPQKVSNTLSTMQPGERVIFEIKRHPIGLIFSYAISGAMIIATAVLAFIVAPGVAPNSREAVTAIATVIFLVVTLFAIAFVFIANKVYWGNSWVLTSDSITQVTQSGLFNRQSSQLSLENLEDVTAKQHGILTHIFNYGTIKAETAGEHSKFVFTYCSNPNYYAQQILQAREEFAQQGGHAGQQEASAHNNIAAQS
ncbi:MAG: hypothetical protein JWO35_391 [Candidatus Saccharibacteria bacterium]|nr:hypothetical protein [Candidatus Saccharibacteria bacterium]